MATPSLDTDSAVMPDSVDADTCRICRGEGSAEEPLFYPCKCSGSIKFVHQDCLMEWLSHSQKKYCELCKTPFRFTKLYHPQMPRRLPTGVFLRRAALHFLSHVVLWCRALLVIFVWLALLPWTMRSVWRFMFWFVDSGYARSAEMETDWLKYLDKSYPTNYSEPIPTTSPPDPDPSKQPLYTSHLFHKIARLFLIGSTHASSRELHFAMTANSTFNSTTHLLIRQKYSSILSDVRFFKELTSSVAFNRSIMDVIEGLIITLSVVVAFILVFLIREWVIQQQPLVNAEDRAADADAAPPAAADQPGHEEPVDEVDGEQQLRDTDDDSDFSDDTGLSEHDSTQDTSSSSSSGQSDSLESPASLVTHAVSEEDQTAVAHGSSSTSHHGHHGHHDEGPSSAEENGMPEDSLPSTEHIAATKPDLKPTANKPETSNGHIIQNEDPNTRLENARPDDLAEENSSPVRPDMPARGRSFLATEILRGLEERGHEHSSRSSSLKHSERPLEENPTDDPTHHGESRQQSVDSSGKGKEKLSDKQSDAEPETVNLVDTADPVPYIVGEMRDAQLKALAEIEAENGQHSEEQPPTVPPKETDSIDAAPQGMVPEDSSTLHLDPSPATLITASVPSEDLNVRRVETAQPQNWFAYLIDWFWGDIAPSQEDDGEERGNDEHVVNNIAEEEPFVPFADAQPVFQEQNPQPQAANEENNGDADANDGEAAEDVEDLEGILELIGMQGPLIGLFQNAIFSSLLISATIVGTVLVPYWLGKIELLFLGNPALMWQAPIGILSGMADLIADLLLFIGGFATYFLTKLINLFVFWGNVTQDTPRSIATRAGARLSETTIAVLNSDPSAALAFSIISHSSLVRFKANILLAFQYTSLAISSLTARSESFLTRSDIQSFMTSTLPTWFAENVGENIKALVSTLKTLMRTGKIHFTVSHTGEMTASLAYWSASDKTAAVLVGYACVAVFAAFYVGYLAPVTTSPQSKRFELAFVEVIKQAGGVCKVIFIISIEMIAFPLFCGFLLDLALLPLFENASITSRLSFTYFSPWTSGFVHWFVGTCYMFHFALFVSMCRKIMRSGVLYFIRDPDDPTFHPVRDVLERSITVQLRKIAFSAVVYGTLIVVCLGGVVWGLRLSSGVILPIHWTSSESEREFPLDILFFNFLTPVVVRYTKPTDGLHAMYKWWFRRCARALRLSHFLFNEEQRDEQGHWVNKTWKSWLLHTTGLANLFSTSSPAPAQEEDPSSSNTDAFFEFDGRYARVPASDQIRIPKGKPVFLDVDKENNRLDGKPEEPAGTHGRDSGLVTKVYIPPWFKTRIGLFVLAVWMFAAATGVSVTIAPLLFGRYLFSVWVPSAGRINDIYAFSLGIYLLGTALYVAVHISTILSFIQANLLPQLGLRTETLLSIGQFIKRSASVFYVYTTFAIGLPILTTIILELYILLPLHTYLGRTETHIVHLVQDWTLGILYLRIFSHIVMAAPLSIPSRIISAITANGYLAPNARVATRALILPSVLSFCVLTLVPYTLAQLANRTILAAWHHQEQVLVLRLAYPATLGVVSWVWCGMVVARATRRWRQRIKDEVYLIGERLHNFGEKKAARQALPPAAAEVEVPVAQEAAGAR